MLIKKILPALVCLGLAAMACSVMDQFVPPANGATSQPATEAPTSVPARGLPTLRDIRPVLGQLGGQAHRLRAGGSLRRHGRLGLGRGEAA